MNKLVLYNDDVNSFDNVIDSLVDVLDYNIFQAEQCAIIVHHSGKCELKTSDREDLKPYHLKLKGRGLKVKIV